MSTPMEDYKDRTFRILVELSSGWWVAQCLEHELATQARTLAELRDEVERLFAAHVAACAQEGIAPFSIPPAPQLVERQWTDAGVDRKLAGWPSWLAARMHEDSPWCGGGHLTDAVVRDDSIAFQEAHSAMNRMVGNFGYGVTTDSVAAMLEVLADYAVCGPQDTVGAEVFRKLAERALANLT